MKKIGIKFLACMLSAVMLLTVIPMEAHATEDYREWTQKDSRWADISLGNSQYTMEDSGCLIVAVAKVIVQCGLRSADEFTPGTLVEWLNENEGFTSDGDLYWGKPAEFVSGLSYSGTLLEYSSEGYSAEEYESQITSWVNSGYHVIISVNYGGHWVPVDEAESAAVGQVCIMDSQPGSINTGLKLTDTYPTIHQVVAYTGGESISIDPEIPDEEDPENPDEEDPEIPDEEDPEIPEEEDPENPFVDVEESAFYYDAVLWAYENGITTGMDPTHFKPNAACTRGEVVTFLWRTMGKPEPQTTETPFVDIIESEFYYDAVLWAYENGITTGMDPTHFKPNARVERSQFVTFLWRVEGKPVSTGTNPFVDVKEGTYYTDAVVWAYENGITTGKDDTHFEPASSCTRGEVVTFLYRTYN